MSSLVLFVIPMIGIWTWAMLRGWPILAVLAGALGIAPVLQLASGLLLAGALGSGHFLSVPFGIYRTDAPALIASLAFWVLLVGWPSLRLARWRRRQLRRHTGVTSP